MHNLHFPIACSVQHAMPHPFQHSPLFLYSSLTVGSFHFLSGLCTQSLKCSLFFSPTFSASISLPSCPTTVSFFFFTCISLYLSHPPSLSFSPSLFFLVISLSYVCPSLCVCVPPLFVSNSFSREIRDAYLVPLSSTGAAAPGYTVRRWPHRQNAYSSVM